MDTVRGARLAGACALVVMTGAAAIGARPVAVAPPASAGDQQAEPNCSKVWVGREAEYEEYLRTAPVAKVEEIGKGVTRPKRVEFAPGGLVRRAAWKPLRPGFHNGYWDSYKAELAAYELDKILGLQMIPPAVERRIDDELGAVVLWVEDVHPWKLDQPVAGPDQVAWNRQVVTMKMFDSLIANIDRNQGNLIYDNGFHLVLIDHSRAFTPKKDLVSRPTRIYKALWEKFAALTPEELAPLEPLVGKREVRAILERRDRMGEEVARLQKEKGAAAFLP
jgi:hypothetical protein